MSECQHYSGSQCAVCNKRVNSCCGQGHRCNDCNTELCRKCWLQLPELNSIHEFCPVCSGDLITDEVLIKHLLAKCGLAKRQALAEMAPQFSAEECAMCSDNGRGRNLRLCDQCGRGYHFACAGAHSQHKPWFCAICELMHSRKAK